MYAVRHYSTWLKHSQYLLMACWLLLAPTGSYQRTSNFLNYWFIICSPLMLFKQGLLMGSPVCVVTNDIDWGRD